MAADVFLSFHLICDCYRARVGSCFIIAWWRTLKISIPQGDKTLHVDIIWILNGTNAAQVDFFCSFSMSSAWCCVWNSQNRRVL